MAPFRFINISFDGQSEYLRGMKRLDYQWDDLTDIWPAVRTWFYGTEKAQFESQGAVGGNGAWPELSKRYKAQKIRRYGNDKKILEATGLLKDSLISDGRGSVYETTKTSITIGTDVEYGLHHQRGGGRLPQRKIIDFSDIQKRDLTQVIQKGLIKELRGGSTYLPLTEG